MRHRTARRDELIVAESPVHHAHGQTAGKTDGPLLVDGQVHVGTEAEAEQVRLEPAPTRDQRAVRIESGGAIRRILNERAGSRVITAIWSRDFDTAEIVGIRDGADAASQRPVVAHADIHPAEGTLNTPGPGVVFAATKLAVVGHFKTVRDIGLDGFAVDGRGGGTVHQKLITRDLALIFCAPKPGQAVLVAADVHAVVAVVVKTVDAAAGGRAGSARV